VEILRQKYRFRGYIHLKILPGASYYHVKRAVQIADKVSLNIEEPTLSRLDDVCSVKDLNVDLLKRQAWVHDLAHLPSSGHVTQFIVGASDETDREILSRMHTQYRSLQLRRIYDSAFNPIPNTQLHNKMATPKWREHRLYQVDWLYRKYHYPIAS
jgi:predicted DNA-binding helix-hairpin-helix protein